MKKPAIPDRVLDEWFVGHPGKSDHEKARYRYALKLANEVAKRIDGIPGYLWWDVFGLIHKGLQDAEAGKYEIGPVFGEIAQLPMFQEAA